MENEGFVIQGQGGVGGGGGGGNVNRVGGNGVGNNASVVSSINAKGVEGVGGGGVVGSDATILFVSDLHWWTIDVELQTEFSKYGSVKKVKFFNEKASGKSKGCPFEFFYHFVTIACKVGMEWMSMFFFILI